MFKSFSNILFLRIFQLFVKIFSLISRIPFVKSIVLCSTVALQDQIQEILFDHICENERIKYFFMRNVSPNRTLHNNSLNQQSITKNRLLKSFLNSLKNDEQYDVVVIHDPKNPYVNEKLMRNVCVEAVKNGGSCVSSNEKPSDLLFKLEDHNIAEEKQFSFKNSTIDSIGSAIAYEQLDTNYRVAFKPQAFQFSIFRIIFENVLLRLITFYYLFMISYYDFQIILSVLRMI